MAFMRKKATISQWWKAYSELNLCDGAITFIIEDDEDMIEISYEDGLFIAVGKLLCDNQYHITVVPSNDEIGWKSLLADITVADKKDLPERIQETIMRFRLSS